MKYTPIPSDIIPDGNLPDGVFRTYCLIMKKCWNPDSNRFEWTEPVSMSVLAREIGRPRTTLLRHIGLLAEKKLVQTHYFSEIAFTLIPTATVQQWSKVSTSGPITINTDSIKKIDSLRDSEEEDVHQWTPVHQRTVDAELVEFLRTEGVGEPMRSRIATSGKTLDYVKAWFTYVELKDQPVSHALVAIRDDLPAPEYCPLCRGVDGKHRGLIDEDSHFMTCPREDDASLTTSEVFARYGELRVLDY